MRWTPFIYSTLGGFISAFIITALIYTLHSYGIVLVSINNIPQLYQVLSWINLNLGNSIWLFIFIALAFFFNVFKLSRLLNENSNSNNLTANIQQQEVLLDTLTVLFFGIGVIWTALGLRAALINSLDGLDEQTAMQTGAFGILKQLVNGGILTALSTTIVGGIGGYLLKMIKIMTVSPALVHYYQQQQWNKELKVVTLLEKIVEKIDQDNTIKNKK